MFVLLKQYFATDLAYFGRFVLINLAWQSNGPFSDTVTGDIPSENHRSLGSNPSKCVGLLSRAWNFCSVHAETAS